MLILVIATFHCRVCVHGTPQQSSCPPGVFAPVPLGHPHLVHSTRWPILLLSISLFIITRRSASSGSVLTFHSS